MGHFTLVCNLVSLGILDTTVYLLGCLGPSAAPWVACCSLASACCSNLQEEGREGRGIIKFATLELWTCKVVKNVMICNYLIVVLRTFAMV